MVELTSHRAWIVTLLFAVNGAYFLSKYQNKGSSKLDFFKIGLPEVVCFSPARLALPLEQLMFSTFVIVLICMICHCMRKWIDSHVTDTLIRVLLQEAVAAADMCGCCFELIVVADNFGVWVYGLYLFFLTMWWNKDWGNANACPYNELEQVMMGTQDLQLSLTKIWAQLTGGLFVYKWIHYIWSLELIENHENRALGECVTDLQVSAWQGFLVEGAGTFICQLSQKIIAEFGPKHQNMLKSFIGTAVVVAAVDYSGGYFNPVLATALKFGCKGSGFQDHFLVYWIGSCLGSALSVIAYFNTPLKRLCKEAAEKKNKENSSDSQVRPQVREYNESFENPNYL